MELPDIVRPVISGSVGAVASWLVYKYAVNRDAIKGSSGIVQYGRGMKITLAFLFLMIAFIDYAALHARADQRHIAYSLAFLFTGLLIYTAIEVFFVKIAFDDETIKLASPWRKSRMIRWKSIEDYRWANLAQWHVFYTQREGKIRISPYMDGVKDFLEKAFAVLKEKYPERFTPPASE